MHAFFTVGETVCWHPPQTWMPESCLQRTSRIFANRRGVGNNVRGIYSDMGPHDNPNVTYNDDDLQVFHMVSLIIVGYSAQHLVARCAPCTTDHWVRSYNPYFRRKDNPCTPDRERAAPPPQHTQDTCFFLSVAALGEKTTRNEPVRAEVIISMIL